MPTATSEIDTLFQLPLGEFTAAKNALAAKLKKAGRAGEAERVKALPRPPVSAWTVNQLYWRHRKAFDQLIAAGERFKKAQASQLAGKAADLRAPLDARREAVSELTRLAGALLREADHSPAPDTMRRITTTLDALATYGSHPDAPATGRLTDEVDPPGFEALAALVPRGGQAARGRDEAPRVIPFRQTRQTRSAKKKKGKPEDKARQREKERKAHLAAATSALRDAERTLREARKTGERAEAALRKAAARAKEAEKAKAELEKRVEKAAADADQARQEARRVASAAEDAAQAVEDAERALEKARRELKQLAISDL